ncbi:UDP-glycosyltransferase [Dysgonomonas sp. Marseille-P4361]|uniref:UDP-glycosyltransferase n=1 Tax=Dysgonomonas sp. Marseille-P4361 TaxID=2161820 RepID=UPI000D5526C5|nr:UDP-glycosyltransferase [Dysgonomonas sp. Marseille-P4361]
MNILVANNQLERTGGTENYTYAIIEEFLRCGHSVEYFTFRKGEISDKIEALNVRFRSKRSYDLIIANHTTTVEKLHLYGCIIQTCHGITPILEQPSSLADFYVSVSYEVQQYLKSKGYNSIVINNGVNCDRFIPETKINKELKSVLSLCQSEEANNFVRECCLDIGAEFKKLNKHIDNLWHIEKNINESDLVVGIGRSLYDAMACGRAVLSYDNRNYSRDFGDGYLNSNNIIESLKYNCSGRGLKKTFTKELFIEELKKYNEKDGVFFRNFALEHLNIRQSVASYLSIASIPAIKKKRVEKALFLAKAFINRKFN